MSNTRRMIYIFTSTLSAILICSFLCFLYEYLWMGFFFLIAFAFVSYVFSTNNGLRFLFNKKSEKLVNQKNSRTVYLEKNVDGETKYSKKNENINCDEKLLKLKNSLIDVKETKEVEDSFKNEAELKIKSEIEKILQENIDLDAERKRNAKLGQSHKKLSSYEIRRLHNSDDYTDVDSIRRVREFSSREERDSINVRIKEIFENEEGSARVPSFQVPSYNSFSKSQESLKYESYSKVEDKFSSNDGFPNISYNKSSSNISGGSSSDNSLSDCD